MALAVIAIPLVLPDWLGRAKPAPPLPRFLAWPLFLLPAYLVFQLIPLPLGLVALLSPARAAIHQALAAVVAAGSFVPLSVIPAATMLHVAEAMSCVIVFLAVRRSVWKLGRHRHSGSD
jgi:hypothetical protein